MLPDVATHAHAHAPPGQYWPIWDTFGHIRALDLDLDFALALDLDLDSAPALADM